MHSTICIQFCDKAISRGYTGFVEKEEGRSVVPKRTFKGETVTIQVAEGWRATFDIKNPKVLQLACRIACYKYPPYLDF